MRVCVSDGRSLEMFLRWQKADLVIDLMCDWNERVESRMTSRWRTSEDDRWSIHTREKNLQQPQP